MSRSPLLYPERVRCRTCRRYFGFVVILRAYCSEACAGKPDRPIKAEDLPRSCRVRHNMVWVAKAVFFTPYAAAKAAKKNKIYWYLCDAETGCGMYHLSKKTKPWEGPWT